MIYLVSPAIPLEPLWGSTVGFVLISVAVVAAVGASTGSLSVGATGGYLTFIYYASNINNSLMELSMFVTLALVAIGTAMKLWRMEGLG